MIKNKFIPGVLITGLDLKEAKPGAVGAETNNGATNQTVKIYTEWL